MNFRFLIFPVLLFVSNLIAQNKFETVDGAAFKIDGLSFTLKKEVILKKFGKPAKIFEPQYECGFLSEAEQGNKYYSLDYGNIKFTGNSKEGYLLEEIRLGPALDHRVTFRNKLISHKTTKKEFESIFGSKISDAETTPSVPLKNTDVNDRGGFITDKKQIFTVEKVLYNKGGDDAFVFTFVNGLLSKIEYWSPC